MSRRILVVEDDRDAAALLDEALEAMGHEVRVAFDEARQHGSIRRVDDDAFVESGAMGFNARDAVSLDDDVDVLSRNRRSPDEEAASVHDRGGRRRGRRP